MTPAIRGEPDSLLLRAASGHPDRQPPVWFMRQAGRSLPEYRALREGNTMLEACRSPDLIAEITMQPVRRHGVDAAILFSDIVVPLVAIGACIRHRRRRRSGHRQADPHGQPTWTCCASCIPTTSRS